MSLLQKVKNLPRTPGVYIFKNEQGKALYIGKAVRLRDRVASYFKKPFIEEGGLKPSMLSEIVDIEVRPADSEIEALVLEAFLIKRFKPKFNIVMKDDKQYFYVGFTKEKFPKAVITHQKHIAAKKLPCVGIRTFVGPFVNGRSLKSTLRTLRKVFPYCTCKKVHASKKTCLNFHIGIDMGYCCSKEPITRQNRSEYLANIAHIKDILQGKKTRVILTLRQDMERAAASQQFERAARLRNQLEGIDYVLAHKKVLNHQKQQVFPFADDKHASLLEGVTRIEGYDISNVQGQFAVGSMVVIARDAQGIFTLQKSDYRRFKIKSIKGANDPAMMKEVIRRRLTHTEWPLPDILLIDGGITQRNAALQALESFSGNKKPLAWSLAKKREELYTGHAVSLLDELSTHDARVFKLLRDEAHRFAISYYRRLHKTHLTTL